MKIVYRQTRDNFYEIGETSLPVKEVNRTGMSGWCDSRICTTWSERDALRIVAALQAYEDSKRDNSK